MIPQTIVIDLHPSVQSVDFSEYKSVYDLFSDFTIVMPQGRIDQWRLTELEDGDIKGQPYWGNCTVVATDGIHAFVKSPVRDFLVRICASNFLGDIRGRGSKAGLGYAPGKKKNNDEEPKKPRLTKEQKLASKVDDLFAELV